MFIRLFKLLPLFIASAVLFSCATSNKMELLDIQQLSYEKAIRWGEFSRAKAFHKDDAILSDLERRRLNFYRVTSYSTLQTRTPDEHNVLLVVEIKYYKNDRPVIKSFIVKQHWQREKDKEVWFLISPFPKFK